MLKAILDSRQDLQHFLFIRGFLITTSDLQEKKDQYPFYLHWQHDKIGPFTILTHELQKLYQYTHHQKTFFLIGHAYNPFNMHYQESEILQDIALAYEKSPESYQETINELTGLFILGWIEGDQIQFQLDCSGMQYGCYGFVHDHLYISSHMQLIGDLCGLSVDPYVKELIHYRWYKFMMGNYLPGDLTAFSEIKRIIPNTCIDIQDKKATITRFYPNQPIEMCQNEEEYNSVIEKASEIMHNNMKLITKKWKNPAISLTGGIDSNTTFSAANGLYDQFSAFSYISMHRESVDAEAAAITTSRFNVRHQIYPVPDNNEDISDFSIYKLILSHNDGDIGEMKDNDVRKKITLMQNKVCEIEVKSWIAETPRAYAYKYFGRTKFPKVLKPRHYTSLYKLFFLKRPLVWKTDRKYKEYLEKTKLHEHIYNYDETDFFVWEMMHGGKCGLNIGTMKFCHDITIPYNNRKLLDLLLKVPLMDRISDRHMLDMKKVLNREQYDMHLRVINLNETRFRKRLASIYYTINSHIPF